MGQDDNEALDKRGKNVKKKVACGEWCRICMNMVRKKVKKGKYNKAEQKNKGEGKKLLKEEIRNNGPERERWISNYRESIHLMNGGRSRINTFSETVKVKDENISDIRAPRKQFVLLKKYKDKYGDPKQNKAKVVSRRLPGKQGEHKGVYILVGEEGIYDVVDTVRASAAKEQVRNDGQEVLDSAELEEDFGEARHCFPYV